MRWAVNKNPPDDLRRIANPTITLSSDNNKVLENKYEIFQDLGRGSFGRVKMCHNIHTLKKYAVKVYYTTVLLRQIEFTNCTEISDTGEKLMKIRTNLDKVFEEIQILQSIEHDSCVGLYDVFHIEGRQGKFFLVMEYLKFGSLMDIDETNLSYVAWKPRPRRCVENFLKDKINCNSGSTLTMKDNAAEAPANTSTLRIRWYACPNNDAADTQKADKTNSNNDAADTQKADKTNGLIRLVVFHEELVRCFGLDVARGLSYLHSKEVHVAHRDVKPNNILLHSSGHVKLGDFGVSSRLDGDSRVRRTEGTYHFLPPECCIVQEPYLGHDGRASDVWSLGVSLWCMMFGTVPFDGYGLEGLFTTIGNCQWDIPKEAGFTVSDACKDFFTKVFCKDPTERITALELIDHPWIKNADQSWATRHVRFLEENSDDHL